VRRYFDIKTYVTLYTYGVDLELTSNERLNEVVLYSVDRVYVRIWSQIYVIYVIVQKHEPMYRHWGSVQAVRPIGGVEV
jgi:hypothetical protein